MQDLSLVFKTDKRTSIHQRIIWCCDWSQDSKYFVTGGRDKKCILWSLEEKKPVSEKHLTFHAAVTAVAFAPIQNELIIVAGLEDGNIFITKFKNDSGWSNPKKIDQSHHKTVKKLRFKPTENSSLVLATCGSDNFVQVIKLNIEK